MGEKLERFGQFNVRLRQFPGLIILPFINIMIIEDLGCCHYHKAEQLTVRLQTSTCYPELSPPYIKGKEN